MLRIARPGAGPVKTDPSQKCPRRRGGGAGGLMGQATLTAAGVGCLRYADCARGKGKPQWGGGRF